MSVVKSNAGLTVSVEQGTRALARADQCSAFLKGLGPLPLSYHPRWLSVLSRAHGHEPFLILAEEDDRLQGILPLALVRSRLFGRFLVGLPYVNYGGVLAHDRGVAGRLIDEAVELADRLDVHHLQLRHEEAVEHPNLVTREDLKVHMRLDLPNSVDRLWKQLDPSVRNQVRKGEKAGFQVVWGTRDLLADFYEVFSINMRDLGTPVFGRDLFRSILEEFPGTAEFCVLRDQSRPVAAALLLHGAGITEVPSASALRSYHKSCVNMLLYRHLLTRAVERGQGIFDFGRSSPESGPYRFKKQWGAQPFPARWQFHVRRGDVTSLRRENPRYERFIRLWQRLPISVSRYLGPAIARSIP